jgi:SAM-dependent methyltransferase
VIPDQSEANSVASSTVHAPLIDPVASGRQKHRLFWLSFLMLFLELALIRWLGANVVYLSFFSNLILLASFLGIGIGFLASDRGVVWARWLPVTLFVLVGLVLVFPVELHRSTSDIVFFGNPEPSGVPIWLAVPLIFILVVAVMAMVGQAVGKVFGLFRALQAYRLDIAGSLAGILAFTLLSFLGAPPVVWAAVVAALVWLLVRPPGAIHLAALVGLVVMLGLQSFSPGLSWSPYYQVKEYQLDGRLIIDANGIPHQAIYPVDFLEGTVYAEPYHLARGVDLDRVLIVGAGSGNDVALALAEGAAHIDAVEIDPRLHQLGVRLHPDRPYADPRVAVTIDDGRAFLDRNRQQYDLILFALPDSLTLVSGQASLRLESYLFTAEALTEARRALKPDGVFAMYNFYREDWLVQRLGRTLAEVFGADPCILSVGDEGRLAVLAVGGPVAENCPRGRVDLTGAPPPVTDDYPFLYLRERTIPSIYGWTLVLVLALSLGAVRVSVGGMRKLRPYLDLFAMGVAFLLLETKSVVQFALWFGTTWMVNALVFAGVLVSVLAAIEVARRYTFRRPGALYLVLFASLAVAWAVPAQTLLAMPIGLRWAAATVLTFAPIFIANLIFAQRFAGTASTTTAFGANLLGAMVGGLLEYVSLLTGYRVLIIVVAVVYGAALILTPKTTAA